MKKMGLCVLCAVFLLSAQAVMAQDDGASKTGGVTSLEKRVKQLEAAIDRDVVSDKWYDRIQISGLVEVEAGYTSIDLKDNTVDPDITETSVDLATVELVVDAKVNNHIDGHVMVKWEEDELFIDEGFVTLVGSESFPAYLVAGRQYVPFGNYDSLFVTDPTTLILGETNNGALVAGYRFGGETVDIAVGAFNGRIDKANEEDDHIGDFVASIVANPLDGLTLGASYTSKPGGLRHVIGVRRGHRRPAASRAPSTPLVGGWSAFVTYTLMERFTIIGEYAAALSEFEAGELYSAADTQKRQPSAWTVELGWAFAEAWELAGRYGGSSDGGDAVNGEFMLPESEYGAVLNWGLFDNTNLAFEYIHNEYEDDFQKEDIFTVQLAIEF